MRTLRKKIDRTFSEEDLKDLVFDLNIDWGHLSKETKTEAIRSLISHQLQRGELDNLISVLREERSNETWDDAPLREQQLQDAKLFITESERNQIFDNLFEKIGPLAAGVMQMKSQIEAKRDYLNPKQMGILVRFLAANSLASYVSFAGISLEGEDLSGLNLRGIDLRKANLRYTRMTDSDFTNANLLYADVYNAIFDRSNLTGAVARYEQFESASFCSDTILPNGKKHGEGGDFI